VRFGFIHRLEIRRLPAGQLPNPTEIFSVREEWKSE
jgi:hypothetical protein